MLFSVIKNFFYLLLTLLIVCVSVYIFLYYFFYDSLPYLMDFSLITFLHNQPNINTLVECEWTREYLFSVESARIRAEVEAVNREKIIKYAKMASIAVLIVSSYFGYTVPLYVPSFAILVTTTGIAKTTELAVNSPEIVSGLHAATSATSIALTSNIPGGIAMCAWFLTLSSLNVLITVFSDRIVDLPVWTNYSLASIDPLLLSSCIGFYFWDKAVTVYLNSVRQAAAAAAQHAIATGAQNGPAAVAAAIAAVQPQVLPPPIEITAELITTCAFTTGLHVALTKQNDHYIEII